MKIEINDVTKTIKGALILDWVTLSFESGRIYGLQGPNGSGKTMLMRLVAGLIRPTSGEVLIDGKRLGRDMDFTPSLGLLIESPAFLPVYTGKRNLELLAELQNRIGSAQICQALRDVDLDPEDRCNTNIHLKEDTERRGFFVSDKEDAAGNTHWYFQGG